MSHREQDAYISPMLHHNPHQPCTATLATLDRRVTTAEHDVQSIIEWEDSVISRLIADEVRITALEAGQSGMNTIAKTHAWQVGVSGVATCKRCGLEVPYTNSLPKTICLCSLPVPADDLEQANAKLKSMVQQQASDLMQALARAGRAETESDGLLGVLTDVRERSDAQIEVLAKERDDAREEADRNSCLAHKFGREVEDLRDALEVLRQERDSYRDRFRVTRQERDVLKQKAKP